MIEVRNLKHDSIAPEDDIWILIEKKGDAYFLKGNANGKAIDPHVSPSGFESAAAAVRAAISWADYLGESIIYMRDID
jgi:hypothetical protein